MSYSSCQHMKFPTRGTNEYLMCILSCILSFFTLNAGFFFFSKPTFPTFPSFNYQN